MSRVYFHTKETTIDICGSDRALMWHLCKSITNGFIDAQNFTASEISQVKSLLPAGHYLQSCPVREWVQMFTTYMSVTDNLGYLSVFEMQLNTAILFGSDAIKLAARIHGQCEVHGWFSTKNKEWLCKIIDQGVEVGVFRDPNWRKLQQLAQETKSDRIVMSYSVCNSFPTGEDWDDALSSLHQELEISPQNLNTLFGDSVTGFSFRDWLRKEG